MTTTNTPAKQDNPPVPMSPVAEWVQQFQAYPELHHTVVEMLSKGGDGAALDIATALLLSDSKEATFAEQVARPWDHGEVYTVEDVTLQESGFTANEGWPVYAVCSCKDTLGQSGVVLCGSVNVVAQLINAKSHGWLPMTLRMVVKPTRSGNEVKRLVDAGEAF